MGSLDIDIASRLKAIRIKAGISQTELGRMVGVSYQQMQKYEHGRDRIASSTLQRFAEALRIDAGWFFKRSVVPTGEIPVINENLKIAAAVQAVRSPTVRKRLIALIIALASEDAGTSKIAQKRLMVLADSIAEEGEPETPTVDGGLATAV